MKLFNSLLAILAVSASCFAANALASEPVTFKMCVGGPTGFYYKTGDAITSSIKSKLARKGIDVNVELVETSGTNEIIDLFGSGDCDMMIGQADGITNAKVFPANVKVWSAHQEAVYFLVSKKWHEEEGIDDLSDLEGNKDLRLAIPDGSGAMITLTGFASEDSGYEPNRDLAVTDEIYDNYGAAEIVANGFTYVAGQRVNVAGTLIVTRPGVFDTAIVEDFRGQLLVGQLTDKDFDDATDRYGAPLYEKCEITAAQTKGLERATWGAQNTICMRAQVIMNQDWYNTLDAKDAKTAKREVPRAVKGVVKVTRGE